MGKGYCRDILDTRLHPGHEFFRETGFGEIPELLDKVNVRIVLSLFVRLARQRLVGGEDGLEAIDAAVEVFGEEATFLVRIEDGELQEVEQVAEASHVAIVL